MNMNNSSYKELLVWKTSMEEGLKLYKRIKNFPRYEQMALCFQMRKSIISIPSNIAEGHSRNSNKEFINFLSISRGSVAELQTQIQFAIDMEYLNIHEGEEFIYKYNGIDIMLKKLMKSIQNIKT